ncbi:MAG: hypothetical protein A3E25_16920 [Burkholderiales bacterium RIFCSPHIGHO2_12_FULL_69_20]|nr:MAG: hypothetical protein A3E25_16920 [Burkholderiales bacterium RIFCSPHIGHO2_12_FULL_69_20]
MRPARLRLLSLFITCGAALLLGQPAQAATAAATTGATARAKPATKTAAVRPAPKPATQRQRLKSQAKGLALATETVEAISEGQLDVASRVLTGASDCEFNQQISVQPLAGVPGYFTVSLKGKRYRMLPRETATGAVRLEDPGAGVVWLQIPTKSMLMNARIGQRMVDNCLHSAQRIAVNAVVDAGQGIGIVTPALPAAASDAASTAAATAASAVAAATAAADAVAAVAPAAAAAASDAAPAAVPMPAAASAPPTH